MPLTFSWLTSTPSLSSVRKATPDQMYRINLISRMMYYRARAGRIGARPEDAATGWQ
jgi:hypothetical protein